MIFSRKTPDIEPVDEKKDIEERESVKDVDPEEEEYTESDYKRLVRKIDRYLMPLMMVAYGLQYIDKTSLSSGIVFGLKDDTHLKGNEYANLTPFFYVGYFFAQVPMQWLLQKLPFGKTLASCIMIWGALVMCLAAAKNYAHLSVLRVLIGWFESVITPSFAILTSSWYLRNEQTMRQGIYYSMNHFINIVMSVAIYAIAKRAQETGTISGWKVINLFLGALTIVFGFLMFWFVDNPNGVFWLSKREKRMAHARVAVNGTGGGESHPWRWEQVRECLKDPQFWFAQSFNFFALIPNGALTTFQFLIFKSFGFDSLQTILMSLPMFGINFCFIVAAAVCISYKPWTRFPIAIVTQLIGAAVWLFVGLSGSGVSRWAKYGMFLFCHTFVVAIFMIWPLMSVNVAGRTKKSFFSATSLMSYCIGNTVGSQILIPKDAPDYRHGLVACAIVLLISVANTVGWWYYYVRQNKKRDAAFLLTGMTEEQRQEENTAAGQNDLTDKQNQHFRYSC